MFGRKGGGGGRGEEEACQLVVMPAACLKYQPYKTRTATQNMQHATTTRTMRPLSAGRQGSALEQKHQKLKTFISKPNRNIIHGVCDTTPASTSYPLTSGLSFFSSSSLSTPTCIMIALHARWAT